MPIEKGESPSSLLTLARAGNMGLLPRATPSAPRSTQIPLSNKTGLTLIASSPPVVLTRRPRRPG